MMYRTAFSLLAMVAAGACGGSGATAPMTPHTSAAAGGVPSTFAGSEEPARSGALHVTKECSAYTGQAGSFCTITSSNLKQIPAGSRVVYAKAAGATSLDTDVIVYPPGRGASSAFGHVVLDFVSGTGRVTLSGGTGKFRNLQGAADVSHLTGPNWAWEGSYSFSNEGEN